MIRPSGSWVRCLSGALALILGLGVTVPAMAAEATKLPPSTPLTSAVAAKLAQLESVPSTAFAQAAPTATAEPKPFLKTTKGVIAVTLLAGGLVWTVVSQQKDAVHSPARN